MEERQDNTIYKVVMNHEEQYSIWPAERENALGWKDVGRNGPKPECLAYIKEVWTDMRPLSLRKQMEESARKRAQNPPASIAQAPEPERESLVSYLSKVDHPVESCLRTEKTASALKERIDLGYVHIKFT